MTHQELFKLHELKGRLEGRAICLESDIKATSALVNRLETEKYQAHWSGRFMVLTDWARSNASILAEVDRIIKEAENA